MTIGVENSSRESAHQLPKHFELPFRSGHVNVTLWRCGPILARCNPLSIASLSLRGRDLNIEKTFADFSSKVARRSSRPLAFVMAAIYVIGRSVAGPAFHFSDTWQLVMKTVSSIATFLMVTRRAYSRP
jgi:hypothetical protein